MSSIVTKFALLGSNLRLTSNVRIEYNSTGYITDIEETSIGTSNNLVVIPAFFNAHIHAADIGIRNQVGNNLQKVVGPGGIKHQYLNSLTSDELFTNIKTAIHEAKENGILGYCDFREGGIEGNIPYQNLHQRQEYQSFLPLLRPLPDEFDKITKNMAVGVRDVTAYSHDKMTKLAKIVHDYNGLIQIHASEDHQLRQNWISQTGKSDIIWAVDRLNPNAIVHATLADANDINYLTQSNTGVIVCPTSNQYFGVGSPPIQRFLEAGITIGIGSDNAMVNKIALWNDFKLLQDWGISSKTILKMATTNGAKLAQQNWGITPGNSHFMIFDIPNKIDSETLFDWLLKPSCLDHLVKLIYPNTTQSDN